MVTAFIATMILSTYVAVSFYIVCCALIDGALDISSLTDGYVLSDFLSSEQGKRYSADSAGFASCVSIVVGALWLFVLRGKRFVTTDVTRKNSPMKASMFLQLFVVMFGVQFVMMLINLITQPLLDIADLSATEAYEESVQGILASPWGFIYVVLVGPIVEELVFRGAVMRTLERYGANLAIVISAIIFGLYHIILFQAVFAFFIGLVLAYVAGRYSLKWSILLHLLNNLLATIVTLAKPIAEKLAWLSENAYLSFVIDTGAVAESIALAVLLIYVACFIAGIVLLIVRNKLIRTQKYAGRASVQMPFITVFTSPFFICFAALFLSVGALMLLFT
jgi:membrane protease YdiL (CAAX protease family)